MKKQIGHNHQRKMISAANLVRAQMYVLNGEERMDS